MSEFNPKGLREFIGEEKFQEVKETFLSVTDNLKIIMLDGNIRIEKDGFLEAVSKLKFLKIKLELEYAEKDSNDFWIYSIDGKLNDKGEWLEDRVD